MDFFISGRLRLDDDAQLAALLVAQRNFKTVVFKSGQSRRHVFDESRNDELLIVARTYTKPEIKLIYDEIKAAMTKANISGWVAWHGCNHEQDGQPCSHNEYFANGTGVY